MWGKLDDRLDDNEKFSKISLSAAGLWLLCLPRALRNDDAFVPISYAKRFSNMRGRGSIAQLSNELIGAGLWETVDGGWLIHDFEKYAHPKSKSTERVQRYRARKMSEKDPESANGNALQRYMKRDETRDETLSRARPRAGSPEPEPEPVGIVGSNDPTHSARKPSAVAVVFDAWIQSTGRGGRTHLSPKREAVIRKALKSYPVDEVIDAVRGWQHSAHHRGENDRQTVYNDLELLLRDAQHIERFRDLERGLAPEGRDATLSEWHRNTAAFVGNEHQPPTTARGNLT